MFNLKDLARTNEEGASAVEYGLLVALIAAVIVLAVLGLGVVVHNSFQQTCNSLEDPGPMSTSDADCTK